ncbi:DUF429 domain-containing protein [Roseixanthobacter glucoisosaccharinicivorans]|uniref:DUF429 domain-containing protein n=1 Tax=Roseixanthobacter glucoisosaccharinicivorans TaxID=3119923 RepID=UPI00372A0680
MPTSKLILRRPRMTMQTQPPLSPPQHYAGFDGCPGGWVRAIWDGHATLELSRIGRLEESFSGEPAFACAAIDIPIGLPERVGAGGRAPERLVRPLLGMRQSSVFSVPSRAAVAAGIGEGAGGGQGEGALYAAACTAARATSDPPRAVSKQCFHIFPKIAEADRLLRARPELRARLVECHPEVSFQVMQGHALAEPKKVKSAPYAPGLALRIGLLADAGLPTEALTASTARMLRVGLDDLIDASACAWTAWRVAQGTALSFPDPPDHDAFGLPIAIRA